MTAATLLASDFATLPDLIRAHAQEHGDKVALAEAGGEIDYAALDALMDRIAAARDVTRTPSCSRRRTTSSPGPMPSRWRSGAGRTMRPLRSTVVS